MPNVVDKLNTAILDVQMGQVEAIQALYAPKFDHADPAYEAAQENIRDARIRLNAAITEYAHQQVVMEHKRCAGLIADLLAACEVAHALIARLEDECMHTTPEGQQLRAAISKARGE